MECIKTVYIQAFLYFDIILGTLTWTHYPSHAYMMCIQVKASRTMSKTKEMHEGILCEAAAAS